MSANPMCTTCRGKGCVSGKAWASPAAPEGVHPAVTAMAGGFRVSTSNPCPDCPGPRDGALGRQPQRGECRVFIMGKTAGVADEFAYWPEGEQEVLPAEGARHRFVDVLFQVVDGGEVEGCAVEQLSLFDGHRCVMVHDFSEGGTVGDEEFTRPAAVEVLARTLLRRLGVEARTRAVVFDASTGVVAHVEADPPLSPAQGEALASALAEVGLRVPVSAGSRVEA